MKRGHAQHRVTPQFTCIITIVLREERGGGLEMEPGGSCMRSRLQRESRGRHETDLYADKISEAKGGE